MGECIMMKLNLNHKTYTEEDADLEFELEEEQKNLVIQQSEADLEREDDFSQPRLTKKRKIISWIIDKFPYIIIIASILYFVLRGVF